MTTASETAFYCNATWHLARLMRVSQSIYSLACVVAKRSGKFSSSAENVAHFLGYEEKQVRRGFKELEDVGFFEFESSKDFETTVYRVIGHKEWAEKHPGSCAVKFEINWQTPSDPLAQQLYAISGCKKKFKEYETRLLRKTQVEEQTVISEFDNFLKHWQPQGKMDARYWFSRFLDVLKTKKANATEIDRLVYDLYQSTRHVFFGGHRSTLAKMLKESSRAEIVSSYQEFLSNRKVWKRGMEDFCTQFEVAAVLEYRAALAKDQIEAVN